MTPVDTFVESLATSWQRSLCTRLLAATRQAGPQVTETIKWGNPYFSFRGAAVVKWYVSRNWINVYFFKGRLLKDPSCLFVESDTKLMRIVRLFEKSQVDFIKLTELLNAAFLLAESGPSQRTG